MPKLSHKTKPTEHTFSHYNAFCKLTLQPASLYAHGNTTWQHSCSHSTAICNQRVNKRIELRTHDEPLIAEHRGGTRKHQNDRSRNRRTPKVPFIARRSPLTPKNTRFRTQSISQNEAHATSTQPLQCVLQHRSSNLHRSTHMATENGNIHAAIPLRSATRHSNELSL